MAITATDTQTETDDCLHISVWADPLIDRLGHDPRSTYVEQFWLGILGPRTVWLLSQTQRDGPSRAVAQRQRRSGRCRRRIDRGG